MMGVVEAVFAAVGVIFLVLVAVAVAGGAFTQGRPEITNTTEPAPVDDPALPYREALYTAIRIQQAAQEAERELFAKAKLHREIEGNQSHG